MRYFINLWTFYRILALDAVEFMSKGKQKRNLRMPNGWTILDIGDISHTKHIALLGYSISLDDAIESLREGLRKKFICLRSIGCQSAVPTPMDSKVIANERAVTASRCCAGRGETT